MDLETICIDNTLIPYLLCWHDGTKTYNYFTNNSNTLDMIKKAMRDICIRKYKGYKIYIHNLSKFDSYFLIKYLSKIGKIYPIIHKDRIIKCKFKLNESNYSVTFLDSYLMLPNS